MSNKPESPSSLTDTNRDFDTHTNTVNGGSVQGERGGERKLRLERKRKGEKEKERRGERGRGY